jgi:hypothetical protein
MFLLLRLAAGRNSAQQFWWPERTRSGLAFRKRKKLGGRPDRELDLHQRAFKAGRPGNGLQEHFAARPGNLVVVGFDPVPTAPNDVWLSMLVPGRTRVAMVSTAGSSLARSK